MYKRQHCTDLIYQQQIATNIFFDWNRKIQRKYDKTLSAHDKS